MADTAPVSISMDLSQHKTTVPVIANERWVHVRLANLGERTNEKGKMLSWEYHLLEPAPTVDGATVNAGFPIFENITLYSKDTPPGQWPDFAKSKVCKRIDAMLGTGDPDHPNQTPGEINKKGKPVRPNFDGSLVPTLIGKELYLQVTAKTGDYEGNDVKQVRAVVDMPTA